MVQHDQFSYPIDRDNRRSLQQSSLLIWNKVNGQFGFINRECNLPKYSDNVGTSYPASIICLLGDTAVDRSNPFGLNSTDNSLTNSVKPSFSSGKPFLHSVCQQTLEKQRQNQFEAVQCSVLVNLYGYSQSKSNPPKPYFSTKYRACFTNFFLAAALRTNRLYLSPWESFQPPSAKLTVTPFSFSLATRS